MGKKNEKLQRVVRKLADRYGADDEGVMRLKAELGVLETLKLSQADRRSRKRQNYRFQTPAKQLFLASYENIQLRD